MGSNFALTNFIGSIPGVAKGDTPLTSALRGKKCEWFLCAGKCNRGKTYTGCKRWKTYVTSAISREKISVTGSKHGNFINQCFTQLDNL